MTTYYISLPDPAKARGSDAELAFTAHGAEGFAEQLQAALANPTLFEKWKAKQSDPDAVPEQWGVTDPAASVTGTQYDLQIKLEARTTIKGEILKERLRLLAGPHWTLHDVRS